MSKVWQDGDVIQASDLNRLEQSLMSDPNIYVIDNSHLQLIFYSGNSCFEYLGYVNESAEDLKSIIAAGKIPVVLSAPSPMIYNCGTVNGQYIMPYAPLFLFGYDTYTYQSPLGTTEQIDDFYFRALTYDPSERQDYFRELQLYQDSAQGLDHLSSSYVLKNTLVNSEYTIVNDSVNLLSSLSVDQNYLSISVDGNLLKLNWDRSSEGHYVYDNEYFTGDVLYTVEYDTSEGTCNFCVYDFAVEGVISGTYNVIVQELEYYEPEEGGDYT